MELKSGLETLDKLISRPEKKLAEAIKKLGTGNFASEFEEMIDSGIASKEDEIAALRNPSQKNSSTLTLPIRKKCPSQGPASGMSS